MNNDYKVKWGFIGCGHVVEKKSGPGFNIVKNSEVYAIMRRDIHSAKKSAKKLNAKKYYNNIDDLLKDDEVNAIYIATPPGLHYEQAIRCAMAGKATYIEKPFARSYDEAKKIVEIFKKYNVPLFVAHYKRALPKYQKIKQLLNSEAIGKICEFDFRLDRIFSPEECLNTWLYNPVLSGGGKFYDIAAHSIDIMIYLLGDFKSVYGLATNNCSQYQVEDQVVLALKTRSGIVGTANFNALSYKKSDRMVIHGTNGTISFSMHGTNDIVIETADKDVEVLNIDVAKYIEQDMIKNVVETLQGHASALCTGEDALPTYFIMDIALENYYGGRNDKFWLYPERWGNK